LVPDLGSRNPDEKTSPKEEGENLFLSQNFFGHKYCKIVKFNFLAGKKNIFGQNTNNKNTFYPKICAENWCNIPYLLFFHAMHIIHQTVFFAIFLSKLFATLPKVTIIFCVANCVVDPDRKSGGFLTPDPG
jgi:hypothetical protein